MIIDKLVFTESEKQELTQVLETYQALIEEASKTGNAEKALQYFDEAGKQQAEIKKNAQQRYILSFSGRKAAVLDDVKEILAAATKEEFEERQDRRRAAIHSDKEIEEALPHLFNFESEQSKNEAIRIMKSATKAEYTLSEKNYNTFITFLFEILSLQVQVTFYHFEEPYNQKEQEEIQNEFSRLVKEKAKSCYLEFPIRGIPDFEEQRPPKISTSKLSDIFYPIDKVNSELWNCFSIGENTPLKAESDKDSRKGKQASIYVMLDFNELDGVKISRPLTSFDKRVFIAISNKREAGQEILTFSQIYEAMGGISRPDKSIRDRIIESIDTMSRAIVSIDTTEENKIYPRLDKIVWESQLLHIEKVKGYSRGQITDYAIRIIETPKLYLFAKQRNQITSAPLELFESPISKTEANLSLEDYIFPRIARMRNSTKISRTILIETVCQKCNITTKKQRQRLPGKIEKYLKHYVSVGWIKAYKLTDKSIEIVTYSV
ncbi:MAG: hypothetical protein IIT39_02440 [Clostridia bacterium]|nr:hypothetical protein [Clostridia bacterium]